MNAAINKAQIQLIFLHKLNVYFKVTDKHVVEESVLWRC